MTSFVATEFITTSMVETGRKEYYTADSKAEAIANCLYTHRLSDGNTHLGATGLCIYVPSRNRCYFVTQSK